MGFCDYCGKLDTGSPTPHSHAECRAEYERRRDAGECVRCGKAHAGKYSACDKCDLGRVVLPYRGYPPGVP